MRAAVVISTDPSRPGLGAAQFVAGKPLIVRAIDAVRSCRWADVICVVSTEPEVLDLAHRAGAATVAGIAGHAEDVRSDHPAAVPLIQHALGSIRPVGDAMPEHVLWVSPSFPLVEPEDWEGAIDSVRETDIGWTFSAVEPGGAVWSQPTVDGAAAPVAAARGSQTSGRLLIDAAAFYAFRTDAISRDGPLFNAALPRVLARERALEVRTQADVQAAEYILRARERDRAVRQIPRPLGAIVFDFDGVFTDNRVVVFQDGREAAVCDRADGWGLGQLKKKLTAPILVLSTERNPIVRARCEKLRLECINDVPDKLPVLREWLANKQIDPAAVVYVGNDVNDLSCMSEVGCPVAVADAYPQVKAVARIVLSAAGGKGAVRELTELVVAALDLPGPDRTGVSMEAT